LQGTLADDHGVDRVERPGFVGGPGHDFEAVIRKLFCERPSDTGRPASL